MSGVISIGEVQCAAVVHIQDQFEPLAKGAVGLDASAV